MKSQVCRNTNTYSTEQLSDQIYSELEQICNIANY